MVGPYFELRHLRRSIHRCKGAFDRVETLRDFYPANPGFVVARIEDMPLTAQIHFAVGVKVHRRSGIHMSYVGQMAGDVAGRYVDRPAQRDRAMSEIAAHTIAAFDYLRSRNIRPSGSKAILDVVMNPVGDGLHAIARIIYVSELFPGESE